MDGERCRSLSEVLLEDPCDPDDIFSIVEAWEFNTSTAASDNFNNPEFDLSKSPSETGACKRQKLSQQPERMSHITVERNRRKQMNEHLAVLRTLMPCFYVKRGDQASIIGGVVEYINELQQVLQSLESKKQRKAAYNELVISPRFVSSPISPRTPQSSSPYKPRMHQPGYINSPSLPSPVDPSPCNSSASSSINDAVNELVASSKSAVAEVEVKFSGPNLLLKTVSHRIPGQVVKIISALQQLALEILHLSITTVDETMLYSFTIKIGIECQLSAEELAQQIQQTFCT